MSEKTTANQKNKARRRLLKGIVAGGGTLTAGKALPEHWARPVVEAVALPAHAQTTSASLQGLSPFQSGQTIVDNDTDATRGRYAELDSPLDSPNWDTLSDSQILDFFAQPAHAGNAFANVVVTYEMFAEANESTGTLCVRGEYGDDLTTLFSGILNDTPIQGNTIKGGIAITHGVPDIKFNDFELNGNQLTGSFDLTIGFGNAFSSTTVSVALEPGGSGCITS